MAIIIFDILLVFLLGGFACSGPSRTGVNDNWILLDEFHVKYTKDFEDLYDGGSNFENIDCEF